MASGTSLLLCYCYAPVLWTRRVALSSVVICPSVCLFHTPSSERCILGYSYCTTLIGNPLLDVKPTGQHGRVAARSG